MDDQGQSDKLCRSFVVRIFDSLLPFLSVGGFPHRQEKLGKSTSILSYTAGTQLAFDCMELPTLGRDVGSQHPSPCWGTASGGCLLPNWAAHSTDFFSRALGGPNF